jgi:hypothetical protein
MEETFVRNYEYGKFESGIYYLYINTVKRWAKYHRYSNDEYGIDITEDDEVGYLLQIPALEDYIPDHHLCVHRQEKDQITFYWIPYEMVSNL